MCFIVCVKIPYISNVDNSFTMFFNELNKYYLYTKCILSPHVKNNTRRP